MTFLALRALNDLPLFREFGPALDHRDFNSHLLAVISDRFDWETCKAIDGFVGWEIEGVFSGDVSV
jgi:hypothetical protein